MGYIRLKNLITESVTVTVSGAHQEYPELHSIMDIGFELGKKVLWPILDKEMTEQELAIFRKEGMGAETLAPDGDDYDKPTGILNFYISGIPEGFVSKILKGIQEHLETLGIEYGSPKGPEQSRSFKSQVIRIPIVKNLNATYEKVPELNMANRNYMLLFHTILGLVGDDDWGFAMPVETLEKAIAKFVKGSDADQMKQLNPYTITPGKHEVEPLMPGDEWKEQSVKDKITRALGVSNFYDGGVTIEQLTHYIFTLNNIVQWAKTHGYKRISGG